MIDVIPKKRKKYSWLLAVKYFTFYGIPKYWDKKVRDDGLRHFLRCAWCAAKVLAMTKRKDES